MTQKSVIAVALCFQAIQVGRRPEGLSVAGLTHHPRQLGLFGLVMAKWAVFATTVVAAMGSMCYPAISALVSQTATADQQVFLTYPWQCGS